MIVSEETGKISVTNGGRMILDLDSQRLRLILSAYYGPAEETAYFLYGVGCARWRMSCGFGVRTRRRQRAQP